MVFKITLAIIASIWIITTNTEGYLMLKVSMDTDYSKIKGDMEIMDGELRKCLQSATYAMTDNTTPTHEHIETGEYVFKIHKCTIPGSPTLLAVVTINDKEDKVLRIYEFHMTAYPGTITPIRV